MASASKSDVFPLRAVAPSSYRYYGPRELHLCPFAKPVLTWVTAVPTQVVIDATLELAGLPTDRHIPTTYTHTMATESGK